MRLRMRRRACGRRTGHACSLFDCDYQPGVYAFVAGFGMPHRSAAALESAARRHPSWVRHVQADGQRRLLEMAGRR